MMELKNQTVAVSISARPLANFHPNIWGDRFLQYIPESSGAREEQLVEELKKEVKRELNEAANDYVQQLKMVDAIQRLGVEYHFEEEIDQALQNVSENFHDYCKDNHDMYTIALSFRLLRQHGYRVSCKIFDKFKDDKGGFNIPNIEEVIGVLEFFEATYFRIRGEDILDHAFVFTRTYLESILPSLSNPVAKQVHHALYQYSNRRGLTRLEARHYISIYEQYYPSHPQGILRLAKLDFNLLQSMHKRELSELYGWWKGLDVATNLSFARDRMVETYFWILGVYFEPQYALARKILTKVQAIASILDDIFDAYATFEELQIFADAIERWDFSCFDQLPDYMKIVYKALLEVFEEIEEEMNRKGTPYRLSYGIQAMKVIVRDYFAEVKWREEKYKPTTEEYMRVATASCGYTSLIIISFLGMGEIATREAFDWVLSQPDIVRATLIICRLTDDIVGHEFERKREHVPSSIECYMEEHNSSKKEAVYEFNSQIEAAWKHINEGFLRPNKIPVPLLYRILNFARVIEVIYSKGDWYTHVGPEMQSFISQLLIEPVT